MASILSPTVSIQRIELRFALDNWQRALENKPLRPDRLFVELSSNHAEQFSNLFNKQHTPLFSIHLQADSYPAVQPGYCSFLVRDGNTRARFSDQKSWELLKLFHQMFPKAEVDYQHSHANGQSLDDKGK